MAKPRMDLTAFVGKRLEEQDGDVLREGIRVLSQALMEAEVAGVMGAERHERTGDRTASRNGARTRTWDTRVGAIELAIPKVRPGPVFSVCPAAPPSGRARCVYQKVNLPHQSAFGLRHLNARVRGRSRCRAVIVPAR